MISRILLVVVGLSLLTASQAEAQLFRRFRAQPQPQYRPQYQPRPSYRRPAGYQGRLTASQPSRPTFIRRADGSVVRYFPNHNVRQSTQVQQLPQPKRTPAVVKLDQSSNNRKSNIATAQGQLTPVRANSTFTTPVGIANLNKPKQPTVVSSISPAIPMPQASVEVEVVETTPNSVVPIPVSSVATNPIPKGLSLSLSDDVVSASADVPAETVPGSMEKKTVSVLKLVE